MTSPIRRGVRNVFSTVSRRSAMTSLKPITDKPQSKQTSHEDKETGREHVPFGALDGRHIAIRKPWKAVNISSIRVTSPWYC